VYRQLAYPPQLLSLSPPLPRAAPQISSNGADQPAGTIKPRKATLRAHRSALHLMLGHGSNCVTISSTGTIKLWGIEQLQQEGARQGLSTFPSLTLFKTLSVITSDLNRCAAAQPAPANRTGVLPCGSPPAQLHLTAHL
jgi:hypothetical protein